MNDVLMNDVRVLSWKVKKREEGGWLPISEKEAAWATSPPSNDQFLRTPPGSNYPPFLLRLAIGAAIMLYEYFDGRLHWWAGNAIDPEGEYQRNLGPFVDCVVTAWEKGRNMQSIRLLTILYDEWFENLQVYSPHIGWAQKCVWVYKTAEDLGIEKDWPELRRVRPPSQPQHSSLNQPTRASNSSWDSSVVANIGQMQNDVAWVMAHRGGWAWRGWRIPPV
jgi:hypothetical protein